MQEGEKVKNILVVDDQDNIRRLIEISLRGDDRHIYGVDSGEKAIDFAQREKLDLIILDVVMPEGMDGFEALQILKTDPQTQNCPVVMLTARTLESDRNRAFESGASDYITKPFKVELLQQKVRKILS